MSNTTTTPRAELSFELTGETRELYGETYYRIRATRDIPTHLVKAGELGGWVTSTHVGDLPRIDGEAWVAAEARVFGNARVRGRAHVGSAARIFGNASVDGEASISGAAAVTGYAHVTDQARVTGRARVSGDARISGMATIDDRAQVGSHAHITDNAVISGSVYIGGHAYVGGGAYVQGMARIAGYRPEILHTSHYLTVHPFHGSEISYIDTATLYRTQAGGHQLQIGSWRGDSEDVRELIRLTRKQTWQEDREQVAAQYEALLPLCAARITQWKNEG